jgi:hypothetical protein
MLLGSLVVSMVVGVQPARAFPPEQVARGEEVWNRVCAECHGPDSTDPEAPLLLRPDSLRRFPTAAAAFNFTRENMPGNAAGSLAEQEYWDVLAFLLANNGVGAGDAPLGPETAGGMPTRAQGGSRGPGSGAPPAAKPESPPAEDTPTDQPPAEGE